MTEAYDAEFLRREQVYYAHMERFILVHRKQAPGQAEVLIELERTERWAKAMGEYAGVLEPPALHMIEDAARKRGLVL